QPGLVDGFAETVRLGEEPPRDPFSSSRELLASRVAEQPASEASFAAPPARCRASLGSAQKYVASHSPPSAISRSSVPYAYKVSGKPGPVEVTARIQPAKYWVHAAPVQLVSEQSLRSARSPKAAGYSRLDGSTVHPRVRMCASAVRVRVGPVNAGL
ncbi:unnamed protein product, partial [Symbiodinium pilosum]